MHRLLTLICFNLFFSTIVNAQQDTAFFDAFWRPLPGRDGAAFFRPWPKEENGRYKLVDYYISGKVQMIGYYKKKGIAKLTDFDIMKQNMDGRFEEYYDSSGMLKTEGTYSHGHAVGPEKMYYENGTLWAEYNYTNDSLDGVLQSYYKDGQLKRYAIYRNGKLMEGQMYSLIGEPIPFTPLELMPVPGYNISFYLANNIKYPGKAQREGIEGQVHVQFTVAKDGKIVNAKVAKSVHPLLDAEALRVVTEMQDWKPGKMDDEPVDVYYTLPVTFRLED